MALLEARINGSWVALPTPEPDNYNSSYTHLENSFLTANGFLKREMVRKNRAKVFCGYNRLTGDEMALLQSLYEFDNFRLRFTDTYNNRVEKIMYAGPLEGKATFMNKDDFTIRTYTNTQMNFIEV